MVGLLKLAVLRESRDPRLVKVGAVAVGDVAIAWVIQHEDLCQPLLYALWMFVPY